MDEAVVFVVEFGVDGDFSFGSVLQGIVYKVAQQDFGKLPVA